MAPSRAIEAIRIDEYRPERDAWLAAVVEHSPDAIIGVDAAGVVFSWNRGAEALYGYTPDEVIGRPIVALATTDVERAAIQATVDRALREGVPEQSYDARRTRRDGRSIHIHVDVRRVVDRAGGVLGWSVTVRDISERVRLSEALAEQVEIYRATARSLPGGSVVVFDRDLRFVAAEGDDQLANVGGSLAALVGTSVESATTPANRDRMLPLYRRALAGESTELTAQRYGRDLLIRFAPLSSESGTIIGGVVLSLDITAQRRQALLLEATLAHIQDGVVLLDAGGQRILSNDAYARLFGLDPASLDGLGAEAFLAQVASRFADPERLRAAIAEGRVDDEDFELVYPVRRILRRHVTPVGGGAGADRLVLWRDVTEEHARIAERERAAQTDALTGIPNRRGGEAALEAARHAHPSLCVAVFDLDHFKRLNDTHGHELGDRALRAVAEVLAREMRSSDAVCRWGGEEFLAVLPGQLDGATRAADRIVRAVREMRVLGLPPVTLSAGVAVVAAGEDVRAAIARADLKLYEAKASGRDRVAA